MLTQTRIRRSKMKCPDCKGPLDKCKNYYGHNNGVTEVETSYYWCPKCKENFDEEVVEEDS